MSTSAFNRLLVQFVQELAEVFPEHTKLKVAERALEDIIAVNAQLPMQKYVELVAPHATKLTNRDGSMFEKLVLFNIDFETLWKTEDVSEATRDSVWKYLSTLWSLATVVSSLPPEMLASIEQISESIAGEFGEGEEPDFSKVMSKMMTHIGPLMASFGGGMGFDAPPRAAPAPPQQNRGRARAALEGPSPRTEPAAAAAAAGAAPAAGAPPTARVNNKKNNKKK